MSKAEMVVAESEQVPAMRRSSMRRAHEWLIRVWDRLRPRFALGHSSRGNVLNPVQAAIPRDEDRVDGGSGHEESLLALRVRYLESNVAGLRRELAELRAGLGSTGIRVAVIEVQARELGRLRDRVAALDLAVFGY